MLSTKLKTRESLQNRVIHTLDLDPIEDLTEAQWEQKFAEFWGEDAPFVAVSRSTDDSWTNYVGDERSLLDSMKELATSEVPRGWTIPRVFSQCGQGEAPQVCT